MPAEPPVESPASLADAYRLLADGDTAWRPVAGGTDLLVQIAGELGPPPERVLDIWGLDELRGINLEGDELVIGALTTYTDLRDVRPGRGAPARARPRPPRPLARPRSRTGARSAATW